MVLYKCITTNGKLEKGWFGDRSSWDVGLAFISREQSWSFLANLWIGTVMTEGESSRKKQITNFCRSEIGRDFCGLYLRVWLHCCIAGFREVISVIAEKVELRTRHKMICFQQWKEKERKRGRGKERRKREWAAFNPACSNQLARPVSGPKEQKVKEGPADPKGKFRRVRLNAPNSWQLNE